MGDDDGKDGGADFVGKNYSKVIFPNKEEESDEEEEEDAESGGDDDDELKAVEFDGVDYLHDEKTTEVFTIDGKLIGKWDGAKIVLNEEGKNKGDPELEADEPVVYSPLSLCNSEGHILDY